MLPFTDDQTLFCFIKKNVNVNTNILLYEGKKYLYKPKIN